MATARERLRLARTALEAGFPDGAVSSAYYAVLYAARAALSEEDRYAKTHTGTWRLFDSLFVEAGRFDQALFAEARRIQELREGADYDAITVSAERADPTVDVAEQFVHAVASMLGE